MIKSENTAGNLSDHHSSAKSKAESSLFLPEFTPSFSAQQKQWRPLHLLNLYRLFLSGIFISLIFSNTQLKPFGSSDPELFQIVSFVYLTISFLNGITIRWHWPALWLQTHAHIIIDICVVILIMHSSGGVSSGVGLLLLIPIASISILSMAHFSLFYAALASLLLFADQFFLHLYFGISATYTQTGLLGGILFLTAFLTNYLVRKTEESIKVANQREIDLANMEQLTQFIMQRMQTAVIVVDYAGNIKLINDTAHYLFDSPTADNKRDNNILNSNNSSPQEQTNLFEYSIELSTIFQSWLENSNLQPDSFRPGSFRPGSFHTGSMKSTNHAAELMPRFALLGDSIHSGAVIFIEDKAALERQAQQLKLASLGRLTASIAHELRNPLAAIRHAGELLNESPVLEKTDKRLTEIIEKQSVRVNDIIATILDLSRRKQAEQEKINLCLWVKDFLTHHIPLAEENFKLKFAAETVEVCFDPQHLQQIFNNLIQNALRHNTKHNNQTQPILISIGINDAKKNIYLQVMNYGSPIPEENLSRLFEPFFTTEYSGTGLGLYIAQELSGCNSARLEALNIKEGACFKLNFSHSEKLNCNIGGKDLS